MISSRVRRGTEGEVKERVMAGEGRRLTRRVEMRERLEELAEGEPVLPAHSFGCVGGADSDLQRIGLLQGHLYTLQGLSHTRTSRPQPRASRAYGYHARRL